MNYELIKIIQIGFNVLVMGIASSFYMKMLTSKPSFKQHKSLYHTSCIFIMLLNSLCVHCAYLTIYIEELLKIIILSEAKKVNREGKNGGEPENGMNDCAVRTKQQTHLGGGSDDRIGGCCYHCGKEGVPSR